MFVVLDLDDVESICSSSDSDMLDDYCVVPLPDCFDPTKPLDKSMILSRTSMSSSMVCNSIYRKDSMYFPSSTFTGWQENVIKMGSCLPVRLLMLKTCYIS